jgi:serine/threonine-protein kinase
MKITLTVTGGPNVGRSFSFDRHDTFIVGRGSKAHLKLPPKDKFFSRHHFLLEVNPPLCRLTDLESSNGTFVNGKRVTRVTTVDLRHGDVIVGGDTALRVEFEEEAVGKTLQEHLPDMPAGGGELASVTRRQTIREALPWAAAEMEATADWAGPGQPATRREPEANADAAAGVPPGRELGEERLGDYVLQRQVGAGGMGTVHLARHVPTGRLCAVKTIKPGGAATERAIQRFLREASILGKLQHEHIVSYLETGHCGERVYFAMEYVEGTDAWRILKKRGPLGVSQAVSWICQLLAALEYAHGQKYVHRDIKPSNLLIAQKENQEHVKLADFGLARVYHSSTLSGLTLEGDVGGSLPYMPPEQITNYRDVDPRSDLYSTAATLYALLTGNTPYELPKKSAAQLVVILQSQPVDIRHRRPDLPPHLCDIIQRALSREPGDRFASAAQMRQELAPFMRN